jgi:hypothetical protein
MMKLHALSEQKKVIVHRDIRYASTWTFTCSRSYCIGSRGCTLLNRLSCRQLIGVFRTASASMPLWSQEPVVQKQKYMKDALL